MSRDKTGDEKVTLAIPLLLLVPSVPSTALVVSSDLKQLMGHNNFMIRIRYLYDFQALSDIGEAGFLHAWEELRHRRVGLSSGAANAWFHPGRTKMPQRIIHIFSVTARLLCKCRKQRLAPPFRYRTLGVKHFILQDQLM
jgi:hypothetical protein